MDGWMDAVAAAITAVAVVDATAAGLRSRTPNAGYGWAFAVKCVMQGRVPYMHTQTRAGEQINRHALTHNYERTYALRHALFIEQEEIDVTCTRREGSNRHAWKEE
ncbi:unnamed protein product [Thelazia callipaeda]|uniref:Secreted protein n=1 Tax=Thelazia callipaeda TaxID=103827 RepID=A0A0N5D0A5_THECL|nr:unnamed protein product [Thelazia callipaeda]